MEGYHTVKSSMLDSLLKQCLKAFENLELTAKQNIMNDIIEFCIFWNAGQFLNCVFPNYFGKFLRPNLRRTNGYGD